MIILSNLVYSECSDILSEIIFQFNVSITVFGYFTKNRVFTISHVKCITGNIYAVSILSNHVIVSRQILECFCLACADSKVISGITKCAVSLQKAPHSVEDKELECSFNYITVVILCSLRNFQIAEILYEFIIQREIGIGFLSNYSLSDSSTVFSIECITYNRHICCFFFNFI